MSDAPDIQEPLPQEDKSWVWHATLDSRAAGKASVLACVETIIAVTLYWWIAIKWDTHWHLLSSVFVAPLLLLRSPESIDQAVRWFVTPFVRFKEYNDWPTKMRWLWKVVMMILSGGATYLFASWFAACWMVEQKGWSLVGWATLLGMVSLVFAFGVGIAVAAGIVEVCGIGMLMLAGRACSHKENDNWEVYTQSGLKKDLFMMNALIRIRSLAAKAFIIFGLGMCLISFPNWKKYAPLPILHRLEKFYEGQNVEQHQ